MTLLEFAEKVKNKISARLTEINAALAKKGQTECSDMKEVPAKIEAIETGITPEGEIEITENGAHDVTMYASAAVKVPIPDGYVKPNGNKAITSNGTGFDVKNYATASVNVPIPNGYVYPSGNKSIISNGTGIDVKSYATVSVDVPVPSGYVYPAYTNAGGTNYVNPGESISFSAGTYLSGDLSVVANEQIIVTEPSGYADSIESATRTNSTEIAFNIPSSVASSDNVLGWFLISNDIAVGEDTSSSWNPIASLSYTKTPDGNGYRYVRQYLDDDGKIWTSRKSPGDFWFEIDTSSSKIIIYSGDDTYRFRSEITYYFCLFYVQSDSSGDIIIGDDEIIEDIT